MINHILIFAIYISAAVLVGFLGRRRKWGFWGYLWSSILFTPLSGLLFVLAADPAPKQTGPAARLTHRPEPDVEKRS